MTPCILALHGFTGSGEEFDALKLQCPRSWSWHTPDLPGHGKNALLPTDDKFTLEAHLAFLESERKNAFGDTPCFLLGYSMGGRIALHWALANPAAFAGLILLSASPGIEDDDARARRVESDQKLAQKILRRGSDRFLERWMNLPLFSGLRKIPTGQMAALRHRRRFNTADRLAASLRGVGTGSLPSLWDRLPEAPFPALFLAGSHDAKFVKTATAMSLETPGSTFEKISRSGHVVHLEQPGETAKAIIHFISKNSRA